MFRMKSLMKFNFNEIFMTNYQTNLTISQHSIPVCVGNVQYLPILVVILSGNLTYSSYWKNNPFIDDIPIKHGLFNSYVELPEGNWLISHYIPLIYPNSILVFHRNKSEVNMGFQLNRNPTLNPISNRSFPSLSKMSHHLKSILNPMLFHMFHMKFLFFMVLRNEIPLCSPSLYNISHIESHLR